MFERLTADQRALVESEVNANMNRTDTPAAAWRLDIAPELIAAFRAAAMQRVGIAPLVPELSWDQLFEPWKLWRVRTAWPDLRAFDMLPINVMSDFRPMHKATADAAAHLRRSAINVPAFADSNSLAKPDGASAA